MRGDRFFILLRGAGPLVLVALGLLAGPTLLTWWLKGGPFRLSYLLIGGAVTVGLLAALWLALGWAVGRLGRGRRR